MASRNSSSKAMRTYFHSLIKRWFYLPVVGLCAYCAMIAVTLYRLLQVHPGDHTWFTKLVAGQHEAVIGISIAMAIIMSMALFREHHEPKISEQLHSLPVTRAQMYRGIMLSGILMTIVPVILSAVFMYGAFQYCQTHPSMMAHLVDKEVVLSYMSRQYCLRFGIITLLDALYVFMVAAFVGTLTGTKRAHFIVTLLMFGLPYVLIMIGGRYQNASYYGMNAAHASMNIFEYLPLFGSMRLEGNLIGIGIELTVIVMSYIFGDLLFRGVQVERLGRPFVFSFAGTLMTYLLTFIIMSILLLYLPVFRDIDYVHDVKQTLIQVGLSSLVIYLIATMIVQKTWRILSVRLILGFLCYCLLSGAVLSVTLFDIFGVSRSVPSLKNIDSVTITFDGMMLSYSDLDTDIAINDVIAIQKAFIETRSVKSEETYGDVFIDYELKNGEALSRQYTLYTAHMGTVVEETCNALFKSSEVRKKSTVKLYQSDTITLQSADKTIKVQQNDYLSLQQALTADLRSITFEKALNREADYVMTVGIIPAEDEADPYEIFIASSDSHTLAWCEEAGYQINIDD